MVEILFCVAGCVGVMLWTVWFICHGRYWAKRTSRWDIPDEMEDD